MPAINFQRVAPSSWWMLALQLLLLSAFVRGFQIPCGSILPSRAGPIRQDTLLFNSDEDDASPFSVPLSTSSSSLEEGKFNPLTYQKDKKSRSPAGNIDIRSMRMSSLTGNLLNLLGDDDAVRELLEENKDFLLEPLEVPDSLAASVSPIYTSDMTRSERYQAYRESVEERLKSSKNGQARAVLTAMRDFVLEFEDESPIS